MQQDAHDAHIATLSARMQRLTRLVSEYRNDLNPLGRRLLSRALFATAVDLSTAVELCTEARRHISSAPPPPAEPSPEGSP